MGLFHSQSPLFFLLLFFLLINIEFSYGEAQNPCIERHSGWQTCANLNYIPALPQNTTHLTMLNFKVYNLSRETLLNLTGLPLKILAFKLSFWKYVATDVFTDMIHLQTLIIKNLDQSRMIYNLFLSLHFTNITTLYLNQVKLKSIRYNILKGLSNTSLHHLHVVNCNLQNFDGKNLANLTKLKKLDLAFNADLKIDSWGYIPSLVYLNLSHTYIKHFPRFQNRDKIRYPKLQTLVLSLSEEHTLNHYTFEGLPKLRRLIIQVNNHLTIYNETFENLPKLKNLSITGTPDVRLELQDRAIVSQSLISLNLKNVTIMPSRKPIDCPNLINLTLKGFQARKPQLIYILPTLNRLEYLEISKSNLNAVPVSICNFTSLTRLNLEENYIYHWRYKNCKVMKNLKSLSLAKNHILKINESSFAKDLWDNKQLEWDLSSNNYFCDCNLMWFRDWLKNNQKKVVHYPKHYRCRLNSDLRIKIKNYIINQEYCNNTFRTQIIAAVCIGSLALITIICSVVAYVKRWSVRYWCYMLWAHHRKYTALEDNIEYIYDAFICYSSSDINWVVNKLVPIVEDEEGFQLCLQDRDFMPGRDIVDNIVEAIQVSRKVVVILSPEFAQSTWCQYEVSLAEQRLMEERRDMLVPVLLQDIPDHIQTRRLATLLRRKTHLEWTEDESKQEMFWKILVDVLEKSSEHTEI